MFCSNCGSNMSPNAKFCHQCGQKVIKITPKVNDEPKRFRPLKLVGLILTALLGVTLMQGVYKNFDGISMFSNWHGADWAMVVYLLFAMALLATGVLGFLLNRKIKASMLISSCVLLFVIIAALVISEYLTQLFDGESLGLGFVAIMAKVYNTNKDTTFMLACPATVLFLIDYIKIKKKQSPLRFCTNCGTPLRNGRECPCREKKFAIDIYSQRKIVGEERAIEACAEAGFTHVNYDICGIEDEPDFISSPAEYGRRVREIMVKNRLSCDLCHAPYFMKYGQAFDTSELQYMEIVRAFECAQALGCKMMVVHSITVPEGVDFKEYNLNFYRSLIPYAKQYNVKIAVENLYIQKDGEIVGGKLETPEKMADFMAELPTEYFTVCVDLAHAFLCGVAPEDYIAGLPQGLIGAIHLHDADEKNDLHTLPGLGKINWEKVMKALGDYGFNGVFACEFLGYFKDSTEQDIIPKMIYARKVLENL